ncbi:MAG: PEGA domain-containing protein, partial [Deltaproteobacteria bacterium]|nr:PEGA domain-containing protein [Deltaproteobacteria bacterium]
QALGDSAVDRRADLYSAAIVMYECLTGDVPFDAANYNALIQVILNAAPDSPRDRGAAIGPELEKAILACLDKKKDRRPSTAREMLAFLRAARNRDELAGATPKVAPNLAKVARDKATLAMTEAGGEVAEITSRTASTIAEEPVAAAVADAPSVAPSSLADHDLVIAPKARGKRSGPPSKPAIPKKDVDADYDPFMETGEGGGKLQLDEAVLAEPRTSLRPSLSPSSAGLSSPVPSSPGQPSPSLPSGSPVSASGHGRGDASQNSGSWRPAAKVDKKSNSILYLVGALVLVGGGILAARYAMLGDPGDIPVVERPNVPEIQRPQDPPPEVPSGGRVTVELWGTPPGASVRLDGLPAGSFPIQVRRGSSHTLEITAIGYAEREIEFTATEDTRIRGNLRPATGGVP